MKHNLCSLLFILLSFTLCSQNEAHEIIQKSIQYHDPNGNWNKLQASIQINSIVERKGKRDTSSRSIIFDFPQNIFQMNYLVDAKEAKLYLDDANCFGEMVDEQSLTKEHLADKNITCERARMFNNYFRFLIGLPMKLMDEGTIIHDIVKEGSYKGKLYYIVKVTYQPEVGSDTWLFYFDKKTYELQIAEFSKDGSFNSGETIEINNKLKFQKMLLPGQLVWYVLPERPFLAEENIIYSGIKEP